MRPQRGLQEADTRGLYEGVLSSIAGLLSDGSVPHADDRRLALLGIYWPSKRFTDRELIPGGAAALGGAEDLDDLLDLPDALETEPVRLGEEQPIGAEQLAAIERSRPSASAMTSRPGRSTISRRIGSSRGTTPSPAARSPTRS